MKTTVTIYIHDTKKDSGKMHIFNIFLETVTVARRVLKNGKAVIGKTFFCLKLPIENHKWKYNFQGTRECNFYVCLSCLPQKGGKFLLASDESYMS